MKKIYKVVMMCTLPLLGMLTVSCEKDEEYVLQPKPSILELSQTEGLIGTEITITGTNMMQVDRVKFGSVDAANFNKASNTETTVKATVPEGLNPGMVDLTVYTQNGGSHRTSFRVLSIPTIASVSVQEALPGDELTITGTNFMDVTQVTFGTTAVAFEKEATKITTVVPANAGFGDMQLTLTSPGGSAQQAFKVIADPVIRSFSPETGEEGALVTITGVNFNEVTSVKVGRTTVNHTVVDPNTITFTVPANMTSGPITVTTAAGTVASAGTFTFISGDAVPVVLYSDDLMSGWEKWGWGNTTDWTNNEQAKTGSRAAKVVYTDDWGGFQVHSPNGNFSLLGYKTLQLSIYGGAGTGADMKVGVYIKNAGGTVLPIKELTLTPGKYTTYEIPFSELGNPTTLNELVIQSRGKKMTIYIDDIILK